MSRFTPEEQYERALLYASGTRLKDAEKIILRSLRTLALRADRPDHQASAAPLTGAADPPSAGPSDRAAHREATGRALSSLGPLPLDDILVQKFLITLAYVRAELVSFDEGLVLLEELLPWVAPELTGRIAGQRGLMLLRAGRPAEALPAMEEAARSLPPDGMEHASLLLNRGYLHMTQCRLSAARRDFLECLRISEEVVWDRSKAAARHNLGYVSYLQGDLPNALRAMDDSIAQLASSQADRSPYVYHVDRGRVLATAGLLTEADEALAAAAAELRGVGRRQDLAEIELTRAEVALTAERWQDARSHAARAERLFDRRGSRLWALLAALTSARIRLRRPGASGRYVDPDQLLALSDQLARHGLRDDSRMAGIAAVEALVRRGRIERARTLLPHVARVDSRHPITLRLAARAVRARVAQAEGSTADAAAERRAGLRDLHRYQSSFGSLDLQTAVCVHGVPLAAEGLEQALRDGRPAHVLAWAEQGRSLASRLPTVCPPRDPHAARLLAKLRYLRCELRERERHGAGEPQARRRVTQLRREAAELERQIRQRSWYAPGPGQVRRPVRLSEVRRALVERGPGTLVAHLVVSDRIHALVVTGKKARIVALGPVAPVLRTLRRVRADLDALAVSSLPERVHHAVLRSLRAGLEDLDAACWRPLQITDGGPVALVPAGALVAVPWTCLPGLRAVPVTVARSATAWVRGRIALPPEPRVVSVSGPHLHHAQEESEQVARLWPGARRLHGAQATGEAVIEAMRSADLLHLAAHGMHEAATPLFSVLHLAGGPVFGHDLAQLPRVPGHVVLAACDLGLATERPGDELLGTAAVLLQGGSGSVVASVARVGDSQALATGVAHHRGLCAGESPASALARATSGEVPVPFVCFGAGW